MTTDKRTDARKLAHATLEAMRLCAIEATKMTARKIESARKLLASGMPPRDVAQNLGVSVPTLYRWLPASASARS